MAIFWGSPEARIHRGTAAERDTVDYTDSNAAVSVHIGGRIAGGYAEGDRFVSIENVWGSRFGDTLTGDGLANGLYGYHGNDTLSGADGEDVLYGEGGADRVSGGAGHDVVGGGAGVDTLIGGSGSDTLEGGAGADRIYGDDARTNAGGAIVGPGPDETGAFGILPDIAAYSSSNAGVVVDLSGSHEGGAYSAVTQVDDGSGSTTPRVQLTARAGGHAAGDVLYGVYGVDGSQHADVLVGDDAANRLSGKQGNDTLRGGGGQDGLWGGKGADTLIGGAGIDLLEGGAGADAIYGDTARTNAGGGVIGPGPRDASHDLALYERSNVAVTIDLSGEYMGGAYSSVTQVSDGSGGTTPRVQLTARAGGHAAGDVLYGVSGAHGSRHADVLVGDDGRSLLHGMAGNDTIAGGDGVDLLSGGPGADSITGGGGGDVIGGDAGNDTLSGGAGNDLLSGGGGADLLDGGPGDDTAQYVLSPAGVRVDLSNRTGHTGGDAAGDQLVGVESVTGSNHNDSLAGNAAANTLAGGAGHDTLAGGGGDDTLLGGAGDDSLSGGAGDDHLAGEAGNDTLAGGTGRDTLSGGAGTDRFTLSRQSSGSARTEIADFEAGEKIDISAFRMTAAQLGTLLSAQGRASAGTVTIDFGAGNGVLEVTLTGRLTELAAGDFVL